MAYPEHFPAEKEHARPLNSPRKVQFCRGIPVMDEILSARIQSLSAEEEKIPNDFSCRDSQEPPNNFKGMHLTRDNKVRTASQTAYLKYRKIPDCSTSPTKEELLRKVNSDETTSLNSIVKNSRGLLLARFHCTPSTPVSHCD